MTVFEQREVGDVAAQAMPAEGADRQRHVDMGTHEGRKHTPATGACPADGAKLPRHARSVIREALPGVRIFVTYYTRGTGCRQMKIVSIPARYGALTKL